MFDVCIFELLGIVILRHCFVPWYYFTATSSLSPLVEQRNLLGCLPQRRLRQTDRREGLCANSTTGGGPTNRSVCPFVCLSRTRLECGHLPRVTKSRYLV